MSEGEDRRRLTIELAGGADEPSGWVTGDQVQRRPFDGWLYSPPSTT